MLAKYFLIIRNYFLSVFSQRKYTFHNQNTLLDAFGTNSRNIFGRNPSKVIPANNIARKRALDFLPIFTGSQRLLGNTSVGIPLAQRQERLALLKL